MNTSNFKFMNKIISIQTITPLHMGTGQAIGTTDLPISREKVTNWPNMPGSSVKGVLKETLRVAWLLKNETDPKRNNDSGMKADKALTKLFGSPEANNADAGALMISDLLCVLFPVRALRGTFAYVTCPLAIQKLNQMLSVLGRPEIKVGNPDTSTAKIAKQDSVFSGNEKFYLEDLEFTSQNYAEEFAKELCDALGLDEKTTKPRLVVVADDIFRYFVENATEVTTHVTIDFETRTASGGMLRSEERVPAEAIFVGLMMVEKLHKMTDEDSNRLNSVNDLYTQFGGKSSVGNGLCKVKLT